MFGKFWFLRNPMTLSIKVSRDKEELMAEFPALPGCPTGHGKTLDEALLDLAKKMQTILETPHEHGPQRAA